MSELDADSAKLRDEFVRLRGYWNPKWESVLRIAPDYFETYLEMCAVPWRTRSLTPKVKELIYIAANCSVRIFTRRCCARMSRTRWNTGRPPTRSSKYFV